jgi:hypothetical protein
MNAIICLTRKQSGVPGPLFEHGYQLECIGLKFSNRVGETVNPDLSLKGDSERTLLLVDCKSGGVKESQARTYANLSPDDVVAANITSLDSKNLILDITFVGMSKNEKKLLYAEAKNRYGLPVVIFEGLFMQKRGSNSFRNKRLDDLFQQGIKFRGKIPTDFYPFSADDLDSYILNEIAPILFEMHRKSLEFTVDDILREAHQFFDYLDNEEKDTLKGRIGWILRLIVQDQDLRFLLSKQKKWKIDPEVSAIYLKKGIQKFIEKCEVDEEKLKIVKLSDFFPSGEIADSM